MFRALAYPLILAVAVGPLLCCCTAGRVLAAAKPPRPEAPGQGSRAHACCAHKQHAPQKPADPKPAPAKPAHPCPCKDGAGKVQAVPAATPAADPNEHLRTVSLDLVAPASNTGLPGLAVSCEPGAACGPPTPFLSVSDLLFSQHRLRC
jgi:hypothetical protein